MENMGWFETLLFVIAVGIAVTSVVGLVVTGLYVLFNPGSRRQVSKEGDWPPKDDDDFKGTSSRY